MPCGCGRPGTVIGRDTFEFNAEGLRIRIPLDAAVSGDGNQERIVTRFPVPSTA